MHCTHRCFAQLPHVRACHATRLLPTRNVIPLLLCGSQRAGSRSCVPYAAADDRQPSRGQPNSRPRSPLQRQRPGPQRPMDARQRRQRPERPTPPFRHEPDGQMAQQGSGSPGQLQSASSPQRGLQQQKPEDRVVPVGSPPRQTTAVHFCLQFDTQYGQRIRLVGSHNNLGSWQLRDGPNLSWTPGNNWRGVIELPSGTVYEYKYVLLDSQSGQALSWQRGNNSVLAIKAGEERIEVMDNWEGQPGAAVVAPGGTASRERRLLDWANDMEVLVNTQRNDLRRARMELAAATEDANQARQELRVVRAELARSRAQQATERRKAAEFAAQNQLLQQHLQETTSSFREALQLVESLMAAEDVLGDNMEDKDTDGSAAAIAGQNKELEVALQNVDPGQKSNGTAGSGGADSSADRLSASATAKSS